MVEAALALPILLLIVISLVLFMVHVYLCHENQILLHKTLLSQWDQNCVAFDIEKKTTETSSKVEGIYGRWVRHEQAARIYLYSPAAAVQIEEMFSFEE